MTAGLVLLINLILTIWAVSKSGLKSGLGTVQQGNCTKTKDLSQWLHLAMNALSTLLLGASNYCMQCISSPTRREVDKAHARGVWLDIGVTSVRNLRRITSSRILLWWLLGLSSVPLHLLYNSAVFASLSTHEYDVFVVTQDWVTGATFDIPGDPGAQARVEQLQANQSALHNLPKADCARLYANHVVTGRSNVLLVTSLPNKNDNSVLKFRKH